MPEIGDGETRDGRDITGAHVCRYLRMSIRPDMSLLLES